MTDPNHSQPDDWAPSRRNIVIGSLVAASGLAPLPSTTFTAAARDASRPAGPSSKGVRGVSKA
jgi:hypothetical protein